MTATPDELKAQLGQSIAELKETMEKQEKSYEASRTEMEEKLSNVVAELAEKSQKLSQVEAALANAANANPNSKTEEKKAEIQHEAMTIFARAGAGGIEEAKKAIAELEKKADMVNTLSDPEGGYLSLPTAMGAMIQGRVFESTPIRMLADVITIGTDSIEYPHDRDEAEATWNGEKVEPADSDTPEVDKIRIDVHDLDAVMPVTQKMLDDQAIDIVGWLNSKAADKFARTEATAFVSGNGVGRPRGFLTYTAGTSTYAYGSIEQVNSGGATTLTADGLIDLQNALKEPYQAGAAFLMKRATFGAVRKLKDGENQYLLGLGAAGLDGKPYAGMTLLGKPVYFADDMEAVGASGLAVAYGDFRQGYQIVDRIGIRVLANPYIKRKRVVYEYNKRVGGGVDAALPRSHQAASCIQLIRRLKENGTNRPTQ